MPLRAQKASDCRCDCGALLARVVAGGVELKCRHCKRVQLVPVAPPADRDSLDQRSVRDPAPARRQSLEEELRR
jgi:phage FluMu protein Com